MQLSVTHVVLSLEVGGLERVVLDLVRQGQRLGQRVSVLCLDHPGALAEDARAAGAIVECTEKRAGIQLSLIPRIAAIFRRSLPDVVHTHQIGALFYAGAAARMSGVPIVVHTEHGKHYATHLRTRLLGRLAGRLTSRFFCVSRDLSHEIVDHRIVPEHKFSVVCNGIDTDRFGSVSNVAELRAGLGIPLDAPVIGTIGRLSHIKQQDLLIKAFKRVTTRFPDARLLLVGDGPLKSQLCGLAGTLGLKDAVHFAGYQARPEVYLQLMSIFALTSRSEGMPLAILEAWAAGVPVVASAVGGIPEMIDHERNGFLFASSDEAALAEQLCRLIANPEQAHMAAAAARQEVCQRFDVRVMADTYARHYAELLSDGTVAAQRSCRVGPCVS